MDSALFTGDDDLLLANISSYTYLSMRSKELCWPLVSPV